jgi:hypothetical protein
VILHKRSQRLRRVDERIGQSLRKVGIGGDRLFVAQSLLKIADCIWLIFADLQEDKLFARPIPSASRIVGTAGASA